LLVLQRRTQHGGEQRRRLERRNAAGNAGGVSYRMQNVLNE
jgi:hypothetical protein